MVLFFIVTYFRIFSTLFIAQIVFFSIFFDSFFICWTNATCFASVFCVLKLKLSLRRFLDDFADDARLDVATTSMIIKVLILESHGSSVFIGKFVSLILYFHHFCDVFGQVLSMETSFARFSIGIVVQKMWPWK